MLLLDSADNGAVQFFFAAARQITPRACPIRIAVFGNGHGQRAAQSPSIVAKASSISQTPEWIMQSFFNIILTLGPMYQLQQDAPVDPEELQ